MEVNAPDCFFCAPDKDRILYETANFYALLGLGPVVEGYVLLVAKQHIRSMFDLPAEMRLSYKVDKERLKQLVTQTYGPTIITEHGRIQACFVEDQEEHEQHCFHAHQLFFPVAADLTLLLTTGRFVRMFEGPSLHDIDLSSLGDEKEYLLFENNAGLITLYLVEGKCPRQFMRYLVALSVGKPELSNWRSYPGRETIAAAKARYNRALSDTVKG